MNLVHFEPWPIADLMRRDFIRLASHRLGRTDVETPVTDWVPAVDIIEEKDRFVLRADVPGIDAADIEVSMDDGVLSLSGERHTETNDDVTGMRRFERASGRFHRRFTLPETADAKGITAKSANGILDVTIPKLPEVQARRITVEAA